MLGSGKGVFPPQWGKSLDGELCPLQNYFSFFLSDNGDSGAFLALVLMLV